VAQRSITTEKLLLGLKKAPILLVEYARLSVMPLGHRAFYSVAEGWGDLAIALAVIALAAFAGWRFRRRAFTAGLVGFTLALLPVLQLLPITTDLADRFALFPSLGLALAVAAGVAALSPARRRLASLAAGAAALVLLGGTLLEERMWMSDGALWRYTVDRDPGVGTSHGNLANVLLKEGRPAEALAEIDRARELGFDGPFMWVRRARALDELGRREEAAAALRAALKETPSSGQLHAVLGDIYRRSGHLAEALAELELAEKYAPNAAVTINLGRALR
jgi:tetratricopeptide (TPR) repeat protein